MEGHSHEEELKKITVEIEKEQVELLNALAREYSKRLGQNWTLSAMLRLAVGDFLTKMGKIT